LSQTPRSRESVLRLPVPRAGVGPHDDRLVPGGARRLYRSSDGRLAIAMSQAILREDAVLAERLEVTWSTKFGVATTAVVG
jgi:hypothetical protein